MGIMRTQEEEHNRNTEQEFLGRCVLCAVVDLLPHIQVVVSTAVEVEWHAADVMEHDIRAEHVGYVGQRPRSLLRDTWYHVPKDLQRNDQDNVDSPRSCKNGGSVSVLVSFVSVFNIPGKKTHL